jgi:hypothetical protein
LQIRVERARTHGAVTHRRKALTRASCKSRDWTRHRLATGPRTAESAATGGEVENHYARTKGREGTDVPRAARADTSVGSGARERAAGAIKPTRMPRVKERKPSNPLAGEGLSGKARTLVPRTGDQDLRALQEGAAVSRTNLNVH